MRDENDFAPNGGEISRAAPDRSFRTGAQCGRPTLLESPQDVLNPFAADACLAACSGNRVFLGGGGDGSEPVAEMLLDMLGEHSFHSTQNHEGGEQRGLRDGVDVIERLGDILSDEEQRALHDLSCESAEFGARGPRARFPQQGFCVVDIAGLLNAGDGD